MNYLRAYCNLIRKAENRVPPEGYVEGHHVFPKSLYGENKRIVKLTGSVEERVQKVKQALFS